MSPSQPSLQFELQPRSQFELHVMSQLGSREHGRYRYSKLFRNHILTRHGISAYLPSQP
jgi:hypothetical protein